MVKRTNLVIMVLLVSVGLLIVIGLLYVQQRTAIPERSNVLVPTEEPRMTTVTGGAFSAFVTARGDGELPVMDFTEPMPLDPLPDGWWHRKFLTRTPLEMSFARIGGRNALRMATDDSASILFRFVDVNLVEYPLLAWEWYVEDPIESGDELTRAGDDHPARLFITFENAAAQQRSMEIIWGNALLAGETKFIDGFPHYVANGGDSNVGSWHEEQVDLMAIYRQFWPDDSDQGIRITDIGLFCDSDETGETSVAYFRDVKLRQRFLDPDSFFNQ